MNRISFVPVMKPARFDDAKHWPRVQGWQADVKMNGWRVEVVRQPYGNVEVFTSSGKRLQAVEALIQDIRLEVGTMLDAEIVVADPTACQCERTGRDGGWDAISHFLTSHPEATKFVVFDLLYLHGQWFGNERHDVRFAGAEAIVYEIDDFARFDCVRHRVVGSPGFMEWVEALRERGEEGIVLKDPQSQWQSGRRNVWFKRKWDRPKDIDALICSVLPPSEKMEPDYRRLGYSYADGQYIGVAPLAGVHKGVAASYIGRVFEMKAEEIMPSGAALYPQFTRWRPDKLASECDRP